MDNGKREEALQIAVEGKAVEPCPIHKDVLFDTGDPTDAYKIASARWRDRELMENWESLRDLTDAIKRIAEEDTVLELCPSCESF